MPFPRLRFRLADWLRPRDVHVTIFWAGVVGFIGALVSVMFRLSAQQANVLLFGTSTTGLEPPTDVEAWRGVLVPTIGGLVAGLLLQFGSRWTKDQPSRDYMEAVSIGDGTIHVGPSLVRSLSSFFSVASGGSIGREGAMAALSTTAASWLGRRTWISRPRLKLMVACGAAAGIAAAYNAPIAGAMFVAEIVLGTIAMSSLGPLICASVISTITTRQILGPQPLFDVRLFTMVSPFELGPYLALGVALGALGPAFVRLLRGASAGFEATHLPLSARLALGGLIVGLLSLARPEVWGNGSSSIVAVISGHMPAATLALVLGLKLLSTCATVGSGAVGGVFTPTLFFGAAAGFLFGSATHGAFPTWTAAPSAYALVGMAAFLAATTQAPLMAMLAVFEMTYDQGIVLPLMLACVAAYTVARGIDRRSIYAQSLKQGGVAPEEAFVEGTITSLVKPKPVTVGENARFHEIVEAFHEHRHQYIFVVDAEKRFLGAVSLHDVKAFFNDKALADLILASEIMHESFPFVERDATIAQTLQAFLHHDGERLPVVDGHGGRILVGTVSRTDLMLTISLGSGRGQGGVDAAV